MKRFGLVCSVVLLLGTMYATTAQAATPVSGVITTDATWTKALSPYEVVGNLGVDTGATLTIEPGVKVIFKGPYKLQVAGRILADGTEDEPITFSCGTTTRCWQGIEFVDGQDGTLLNHVDIGYVSGQAALEASDGTWTLSNSRVHDNTTDIAAIWASGGRLIKNYIDRNGTAVSTFFALQQFEYNTITNNRIGFTTLGQGDQLHNNNIYGNSTYNVDVCFFPGGQNVVDATNNWWGTTDAATIAAKICDHSDDLEKPRVNFEPFATAPIAGAASAPVVTPTPTPSPTESTPTVQKFRREVLLNLRGHLVAEGSVDPVTYSGCSSNVRVLIQRRTSEGWRTVASGTTGDNAFFGIRVRDRRGEYRAKAPRVVVDSGEYVNVCVAEVSPMRRHRH